MIVVCTLFMYYSSFNLHFLRIRKAEDMAGRNDSGASGKKSSDITNDLQIFNTENLQSNMKVIYYRFVLYLWQEL